MLGSEGVNLPFVEPYFLLPIVESSGHIDIGTSLTPCNDCGYVSILGIYYADNRRERIANKKTKGISAHSRHNNKLQIKEHATHGWPKLRHSLSSNYRHVHCRGS